MDRDRPSISGVRAIIVAWNSGAWLERCVASLIRQGLDAGQIWIVDHGTTDGSIASIRSAYPALEVIHHPFNRSYGEAINLAADRCGGSSLLIVNPDTELHPGCLERLMARCEADPMAAAAGPRLNDASGRDVTRYARTRFHQTVAVLTAPGFFSGWHNRFLRGRHDAATACAVTFVEASVMLVRRTAFDAVGGFDEQFTFYGEDADLCWSLRRCGYRLWHEPLATALHAGSASFAMAQDRQRQAFMDGILLVAWKRSLRRYRWKRRWVLVVLEALGMWERARGSKRWTSTQALLRRIRQESYLPVIRPTSIERPTLSVVIPTCGRPGCVDRLLEALARQDDGSFDVILVVQGSSDGYGEVVAKWGSVLRIRRIDLPFQSRGAAKNAGAMATDADLVLFCDDDILPPSEFIRAHRRAFADPTIGALSCRVVEGSNSEEAGEDRLRLAWYGRIVANTSSRRSGPADVAACGNMSFRRRLLLSFGGFDPRMRGTANLEEFDVSERLRAEGWTIWFDATTTVRHRPQPGGNAAERRRDVVGFVRDLHHNLMLIVRRHRPAWTVPIVMLWCAARSIRSARALDRSVTSAIKMWWGCMEGLATHRDDLA